VAAPLVLPFEPELPPINVIPGCDVLGTCVPPGDDDVDVIIVQEDDDESFVPPPCGAIPGEHCY
jgi:hypothetical protein